MVVVDLRDGAFVGEFDRSEVDIRHACRSWCEVMPKSRIMPPPSRRAAAARHGAARERSGCGTDRWCWPPVSNSAVKDRPAVQLDNTGNGGGGRAANYALSRRHTTAAIAAHTASPTSAFRVCAASRWIRWCHSMQTPSGSDIECSSPPGPNGRRRSPSSNRFASMQNCGLGPPQ